MQSPDTIEIHHSHVMPSPEVIPQYVRLQVYMGTEPRAHTGLPPIELQLPHTWLERLNEFITEDASTLAPSVQTEHDPARTIPVSTATVYAPDGNTSDDRWGPVISDLFTEHHQEMVRFLQYRYPLSVQDAEDCVQTGFIRYLDNFDKLRLVPPDETLKWLYVVTHRVTIDLLRKNRHSVIFDFDASAQEAWEYKTQKHDIGSASVRDELEHIHQIINNLTPMEYRIYLWLVSQDIPADQISRITGKSIGTTRVNIFRARRAFLTSYSHHADMFTFV
jgi:RNA polymerase sigma factor (sigma-70 family)